MNMQKRKLNDKLLSKQEDARQNTINKVLASIKCLKDEGFDGIQITLSRIAEKTNLARSTLDKPHVVEVLKREGVGPYTPRKVIRSSPDKLEKEVWAIQAKVEKLETKLEEASKQKEALRNSLKINREFNAILLGCLNEVCSIAAFRGINVSEIIDRAKQKSQELGTLSSVDCEK
jgi:hypothetical protein